MKSAQTDDAGCSARHSVIPVFAKGGFGLSKRGGEGESGWGNSERLAYILNRLKTAAGKCRITHMISRHLPGV